MMETLRASVDEHERGSVSPQDTEKNIHSFSTAPLFINQVDELCRLRSLLSATTLRLALSLPLASMKHLFNMDTSGSQTVNDFCKESKKEERGIMSLNHAYGPDLGAGYIEVNGRYMEKHIKA